MRLADVDTNGELVSRSKREREGAKERVSGGGEEVVGAGGCAVVG